MVHQDDLWDVLIVWHFDVKEVAVLWWYIASFFMDIDVEGYSFFTGFTDIKNLGGLLLPRKHFWFFLQRGERY